ncbi:DUF3800 domain-containing protein [Azonexus caeni]|uniref:DUF3800 domain-containing protein n=1 Tax=Azonexus caeni TaxID=266126 RepID=UPI003A86E4F5
MAYQILAGRDFATRFRLRGGFALHLLYLDESGHTHDPSTAFFVLAGFAVFERSTHWLESRINPIAARFSPHDPSAIEFHGSPMYSAKDDWSGIAPADRVQALVDVLSLLGNPQLKLRVFASVIEKSLVPLDQILHQSFEAVAHQFDQFLADMWVRRRDGQRGLVVCDKASYEQKFQALSSLFKHQGHKLGRLRNFAEVPLFLDSKASRLIQMADLIAYWIFRYYQSKDDRGFRLIEPYILRHATQRVGLVTSVSPATEVALAAIQPHKYPFPSPSPM